MKYRIYAVFVLCFLTIFASVSEAQSSCSSGGTQAPVELAVPNLTGQKVNVYWLDFQCNEQLTDDLEADEVFFQSTFDGHEWVFRDDSGQEISRFVTSSNEPMVLLGGGAFNAEPITTNCSSQGTTEEIALTVINNTDTPILLFWIGYDCVEWLYWVVPARNQVVQNTFVGHDWVVRYADGKTAEHATVSSQKNRIIVDPPPQPTATSAPDATPTVSDTTTSDETTVATFPVTETGCEVMSVTAEMGVDALYTKYCTYQDLIIMGSDNVDDAALEQAWLVAANMFFNRPDVVESAVGMGFHVVIMAEEEVITDIPELVYLGDDTTYDYNQDRNYEKALEEPRRLVIGEENLVCSTTDINRGQNRFVHGLATLTRFVLLMDLAPEIGDQIGAVRQNAIDNGLWSPSPWITENNGYYWNYGVQTYFNSSFDALLTGESDDFTNTRAELADYDPELFDIINSVYQVESWTPVCPTE